MMSGDMRRIYSLTDLVRETGIPKESLLVLLEHYGPSIPSLLDGNRRRFPPEAVKAVTRVWRQYNQGVSEGAKAQNEWFFEMIEILLICSKKLVEVADHLGDVQRKLRANPPSTQYVIDTLPGLEFELTSPINVVVSLLSKSKVRAEFFDASLEAFGVSHSTALFNLREVILRTFLRLKVQKDHTPEEAAQLEVLLNLIRRKFSSGTKRQRTSRRSLCSTFV